MSEDSTKRPHEGDDAEGATAPGNEGVSIFDLFEPPPDTPNDHFGPIPVIPDAGDGEPTSAHEYLLQAHDEVPVDDALAAEVDLLGFEPTVSGAGGAFSAGSEGAHLIDELADGETSGELPALFADVPDLDESDLDEADLGSDPAAIAAPTAGADLTALDLDGEEESVDLPHWTEPATGAVPRVVGSEQADIGGPRWHGDGPQWAGDDLAEVFADEEGVNTGRKVVQIGVDDELPEIPSAAGAPQRPGAEPAPAGRLGTSAAQSADPRFQRQQAVEEDTGGRNVPQAIGVGVGVAALAVLCFWLGPLTSILLVSIASGLAAGELFGAFRRVNLHGAALLGITGAAALPLAVYNRGDAGFTLVIGLAVIGSALWYLVGADNHRPALGIALTLLGIGWVGGLASFAAFIIRADHISMLLATVIITVVSDTAAYAGGRALGAHPFHPASPNKTWEGTIIGFAGAVLISVVLFLLEVSVFSGELLHMVLLGIVVGILAPMGDLTESLVKRDLGVKDMGTLLPGHGGILDRVDGLLFALPGTYYLALVLGLI